MENRGKKKTNILIIALLLIQIEVRSYQRPFVEFRDYSDRTHPSCMSIPRRKISNPRKTCLFKILLCVLGTVKCIMDYPVRIRTLHYYTHSLT